MSFSRNNRGLSFAGTEMAEGTGLEPARACGPVVFKTTSLPLGYPSVRNLLVKQIEQYRRWVCLFQGLPFPTKVILKLIKG